MNSFLVLSAGFELGASGFMSRACHRQENSPVDCFAGGSREANPATPAKTKKQPTRCFFVLYVGVRFDQMVRTPLTGKYNGHSPA